MRKLRIYILHDLGAGLQASRVFDEVIVLY